MNQENKLNLSEQLAFSTVRIEVVLKDKSKASGTGFFFNFKTDNNKVIPLIITNKHVIKDSVDGFFYMTLADKDGKPIENSHKKIKVSNFENNWINHPDEEIDLTVMPIGILLNQAESSGIKLFYIGLDENLIPTADELKELGAVEDILMVGYPIGIWDEENNYPIFRKGITATHPANNYNGKNIFMIDAACFPGSSGSPVFLYNIGNYVAKSGATVIGSRFKFLGILYAGPTFNPDGKLEIVEIPTKQITVLQPYIPINLGYVIKSDELKVFKNILLEKIGLISE